MLLDDTHFDLLIKSLNSLTDEVKKLRLQMSGEEEPVEDKRAAMTQVLPTLKCPLCKGDMVIRTARATGDLFYGCKKYPDCRGTRNEDGTPTSKKPFVKVQEQSEFKVNDFADDEAPF